jgi:NTP pyrophosphatase (non-canonical NTP hydrolase)
MLRAGGYWRPLAAVVRLLEELGELVELLESPEPSTEELASELADLWIITTALADQFLGAVAEPATRTGATPNGVPAGEAIVAAAEIARVTNYYDGPKTPRSLEGFPSLRDAVPRFHEALGALAGTLEIDLAAAVAEKVQVIHERDMTRFEQDDSDPSTAACLRLLRKAPALQGDPALGLRLWGAPAWHGGSIREAAVAMRPSLVSFAKAATAEDLQGYLIAGPATKGMPQPYWLDALLDALSGGGGYSPGPTPVLEIGVTALCVRVLPGGPEDQSTFVLLARRGG